MIKLIFLGTSDSIPDVKRNHTSIFLQYDKEGILVDCGEGTQRQFRQAHLNPCKVSRILITHWHGDHVLGIPGLLQTLSLSGYNRKLFIYGPKNTKKFMKSLLRTFIFSENFPMKIEEVDGKFLDDKELYIESKKMFHGIPCNAYFFVKKGKTRIDKDKLNKLKIQEGSHLQKLKEGKDIVIKGKKYKSKDLTYKEKDFKVSFVLDTGFNKEIVNFVKDSDVLVCEATFDADMEEKAREHKHLTVKQSAEIAKKANVKNLILTHISQRYNKDPGRLLEEAKKIFTNTTLAKDFDVLEIQ